MRFNKIFILILLSLSFIVGCSKSQELADEEAGGATGNFNAHKAAFPEINWIDFAYNFVNNNFLV